MRGMPVACYIFKIQGETKAKEEGTRDLSFLIPYFLMTNQNPPQNFLEPQRAGNERLDMVGLPTLTLPLKDGRPRG
jgi:hypothetical protein